MNISWIEDSGRIKFHFPIRRRFSWYILTSGSFGFHECSWHYSWLRKWSTGFELSRYFQVLFVFWFAFTLDFFRIYFFLPEKVTSLNFILILIGICLQSRWEFWSRLRSSPLPFPVAHEFTRQNIGSLTEKPHRGYSSYTFTAPYSKCYWDLGRKCPKLITHRDKKNEPNQNLFSVVHILRSMTFWMRQPTANTSLLLHRLEGQFCPAP